VAVRTANHYCSRPTSFLSHFHCTISQEKPHGFVYSPSSASKPVCVGSVTFRLLLASKVRRHNHPSNQYKPRIIPTATPIISAAMGSRSEAPQPPNLALPQRPPISHGEYLNAMITNMATNTHLRPCRKCASRNSYQGYIAPCNLPRLGRFLTSNACNPRRRQRGRTARRLRHSAKQVKEGRQAFQWQRQIVQCQTI
jgi:hypothetical protein